MNKRTARLSMVASMAALVVAGVASAERARTPDRQKPSGEAHLVQRIDRDAAGALVVPVDIDINGVRIAGRAAALGAYVVSVDFDAQRVEYLGVSSGRSAQFSTAPVATGAEKANSQGKVKLAGWQTEDSGSQGLVNVASLRFAERVPGGSDTIRLTIESVAAALPQGSAGENLDLEIPVGRTVIKR